MTSQQRYRFIELFLLAGILAFAAATIARGQPLPRVDFNTGCTQTMGRNAAYFGGNFVAYPWQYGPWIVNAVTGQAHGRNGVWKSMPASCAGPPAVKFEGDCWQSVTQFAGTPNTPKWLVGIGAPNMCGMDGLQVWKYDTTTKTFPWHGFIRTQIDRVGTPPLLDGDTAYAVQLFIGRPQLWAKFDLNTMTVIARDLPSPTGLPAAQKNIQGFTYSITPVFPNPLPHPWPGPKQFYVLRSDVQAPTGTPVPTVNTSTPGGPTRTRSKTATPKPGDCCPQGQVCHDLPPCSQLTKTVTRVPTRTPVPPTAVPTASPTSLPPSSTSTQTPTVAPTSTPVPPTPVPSRTPTSSQGGKGCGNKQAGLVNALAIFAVAAIAWRRKRR